MVSPLDEGRLREARDSDNNIIISDSTLRTILSPQLKNLSSWYKVMCGCECCMSAKGMHSSLLSWSDNYLSKLKYLSKNTQNICTIFLPFSEYRNTSPVYPLIFFWVDIDWAAIFSISYYSESVSWRWQNCRKMAIAPGIWKTATDFLLFLEDGHPCPVDNLVLFVCVVIGQAILFFISCYSNSVSWWTQNIRKMDLVPEILIITPPHPYHIVDHGCNCSI